jgi:hypothetical protein
LLNAIILTKTFPWQTLLKIRKSETYSGKLLPPAIMILSCNFFLNNLRKNKRRGEEDKKKEVEGIVLKEATVAE